MDYAMFCVGDMLLFEIGFNLVFIEKNLLGVKGVGEAGTVGALAAAMSAVRDALADQGVTDLAMPATPMRIWSALLPHALPGGRLPDNMGQSWFSPYWETAIEHAIGA